MKLEKLWHIIESMDDESLSTILVYLWNQSRTAGGYQDKIHWNELRKELEKVPIIKEFKHQMDQAYKNADKIDIKVVKNEK